MKNLIYKEFKLSIHKSFYLLIPLLSILILIPNWLYFIALMYFFFISVPNIFAAYNTQKDIQFTACMPVKKSDIVKSKIAAISILELIHLFTALIFGLININLIKHDNFFLNIGLSFFGLALIMFGIFNLIFFIMYFKTAYKYGIPLIVAILTTLIFATIIEFSVILNPVINNFLEGKSNSMVIFQLGILLFGILFFICSNIITFKISKRRFELVEL